MGRLTLVHKVVLALVGLFVVIQLVPYGRDHENPAHVKEPKWDSERTRQLAKSVCFDCHSNQTVWPWYSHVAPVSWMLQHHVDDGREHLNFSEFDRPQRDADEAKEMVEKSYMPLANYTWLHPEARLSDADRKALAAGLGATLGE
jgi:mono/diheme cytochrome c family protein